ncbi:type I phosphomannose isomerase catalytic subunit [Catalinimonas sp. 4WD22]|uniref:type I phosphomannose isomerase catalytic subunit n=1 Tax=Catalinimonas locisalis TaxID=3133978 RepID=UPI003101B1C2
MSELYPLKFRTIFKDKIWGGEKIKTILGKDFSPLPNCGETWEISGVEGNISEVAEGALAGKNLKELIQQYQGELVGERVYGKFQDEFPLLVKFIDANDDLSIQVHPDDALAKKRHNSFGKTEMWYIFQADEGSKLISGFNQPMSKEKYLEAFNSGKLTEILNQEPVKADDVFFLPAGRVHTIGKGLLLAEIQQTSDITYRIYDFDRTDAQGNKRELHVDEALDAIDYRHYEAYKTKYEPKLNEAVKLASCQYFETNRIEANRAIERNYQGLDSFVIYVCMEGEAEIIADGKGYPMQKGDSYLIPASIQHTKLTTSSKFKMLESYVPQ